MSREEVLYAGYRATPEGLCVWPSRRPKFPWATLTVLEPAPSPRSFGLNVRFAFGPRRSHVFVSNKLFSFSRSPGRFALLLDLAIRHAPADATIAPSVAEIALHGHPTVRARWGGDRQPHTLAEFTEKILHHSAWSELRRGERTAELGLRHFPSATDLWARRLSLAEANSAGPRRRAKIIAAWLAACPTDPAATTADLRLRLERRDALAVAPATDQLHAPATPPDISLALALADFHHHRRAYAECAAVWDLLARRGPDPAFRKIARLRAAEWHRYATSPAAARGLRLRHWGALAVAFLPLLLSAFFWAYFTYQNHRTREEFAEQNRSFLSQHEERLRETERTLGYALGEYPTLLPRAEAGDPYAQYGLALLLFEGTHGTPLDPALGLHYLQLAVAQNHPPAMNNLGRRLRDGYDGPADPTVALDWFVAAAALGSASAASNAADLLQNGKHLPADYPRALAFAEQAAAEGIIPALKLAGWMHEQGQGTPIDLGRALGYYRHATKYDDRWTHERLVRLLYANPDLRLDPHEHRHHVRQAAFAGSITFLPTHLMIRHTETDEPTAEDLQLIKKLRQHATEGYAPAHSALAYFHRRGWGVPFDLQLFFNHLEQAFALGDSQALRN